MLLIRRVRIRTNSLDLELLDYELFWIILYLLLLLLLTDYTLIGTSWESGTKSDGWSNRGVWGPKFILWYFVEHLALQKGGSVLRNIAIFILRSTCNCFAIWDFKFLFEISTTIKCLELTSRHPTLKLLTLKLGTRVLQFKFSDINLIDKLYQTWYHLIIKEVSWD